MGMGILCLRGGKGSETTGDKEQAVLSAGQPLDLGGAGVVWQLENEGVEFEGP